MLALRHERELTDDQDFSACIQNGDVHHASLVREYSQIHDLAHEIIDIAFAVIGADSDEHEIAFAYLGFHCPIYRDGSMRHTLNYCFHIQFVKLRICPQKRELLNLPVL